MTLGEDLCKSGGGYDDGYSECPCFWGRGPGSLIKRSSAESLSFENIRVLDAGCGEGKNAVYMAQRGAQVLALDISSIALRNARAMWPSAENVVWTEADIRTVDLPDNGFDVALAYGLLHCLRSFAQVEGVVSKLKAATRPGGFNVICAFNDRSQDLSAHPGFQPCLLPHDAYVGLYQAWDILLQSDTNLHETHPHNRIPHTHSMTRMILRRPI